jgi:SAM-dependent methyltransferase
MPDFNACRADPRLAPLLAGFPPGLFEDRLYRSIQWADHYVLALTLDVVGELGLAPLLLAEPDTAAGLCAKRGLRASFAPRLDWLLRRTATAGLLQTAAVPAAGETGYQAPAPLPQANLEELRGAGVAIDPRNAPTLALLDAAAATWPALAHGEATGEEALLGAGVIGLWLDYFSNDNLLYAANNQVAASAAVVALADRTDARVLEVGAGAGSATRALLAACSAAQPPCSIAHYHVTEPNAFFRRRAERALKAERAVPLVFGGLDIDRPWAEQGIAPGSLDLIFGVNVLHVAGDLGFSLGEARRALAPGGCLVAGECLRPFPRRPIYIEFVFQLLDSFLTVGLDAATRPEPGFLTPEHWQAALIAAGFSRVCFLPDHRRSRDIFPDLLIGGIIAA